MKSILLLISFTLLTTAAFCQNYCDDIEKRTELDGSVGYVSKPYAGEPVSVWKIHSQIFMILNIRSDKHTAEKGLFITMSDGSKISLSDTHISSTFLNSGEKNIYGCRFFITDKYLNELTTKYIVKFSFGDLEKNVPKVWAVRYMDYVKCIRNKAG